ncbi:MAG: superoxide dismutase, Ni [Elusimicrobia bacterium RIFCSPLOWO2_01_FULL_59_12]|nr:MAG: superoxide dismutase, Ni [Elusimicrobia bacterium RIFCSPLOWO2_01_FULL_59_12]
MTLAQHAQRLIDFIRAPKEIHAHCDIPCGIYDPHAAQIAALSVIRMNQLIQEMPKISAESSAKDREAYVHQLSRYTRTKEEHAEICKHELRVLWGDYFKPDHLKQYPDLHTIFWDAMKLASKNRQEANLDAANQLLAKVQQIAEIFWKSKGADVRKQPSLQNAKGELVYPVPK